MRQLVGYDRLDKIEMVDLLNSLYKNELNYFLNFFISSSKLISKQRIGSKIKKIHQPPKTPYEKLWDSEYTDEKIKMKLYKISKLLNPFKLQRSIKNKINAVLRLSVNQAE